MIGERIRIRLKSANSNASDLARHCGVSPQAANQWLKDQVEPRRKYKELIANFFGITPQELEYGPVLSLTPSHRSRVRVKANDPKVSNQVADLILAGEAELSLKSSEYRQGTRDRILSILSKVDRPNPHEVGTCQADAYNAGQEHGQRLLDRIQN